MGFGIVEICHWILEHTFNKYSYVLHYLNVKVSLDFLSSGLLLALLFICISGAGDYAKQKEN